MDSAVCVCFVAFWRKLLVCMLHFISKSFHSNDEDFLFSLSFCIIAVAGSPCYVNVHTLYFFCGPLQLLVLVFKNLFLSGFVTFTVVNVSSWLMTRKSI